MDGIVLTVEAKAAMIAILELEGMLDGVVEHRPVDYPTST